MCWLEDYIFWSMGLLGTCSTLFHGNNGILYVVIWIWFLSHLEWLDGSMCNNYLWIEFLDIICALCWFLKKNSPLWKFSWDFMKWRGLGFTIFTHLLHDCDLIIYAWVDWIDFILNTHLSFKYANTKVLVFLFRPTFHLGKHYLNFFFKESPFGSIFK